jgi:hypothetical protein
LVWDLIMSLADALPWHRWQLIGGQMVALHALAARRSPMRTSRDADMLADLLTAPDGLEVCVNALRRLGLQPVPDSAGRVYRFKHRDDERLVVDLLAPDHRPPRFSLRTSGGYTIEIRGGHQALQRPALIPVTKNARAAMVPVPDVLGALVLKAAAWQADLRDRGRHADDAALLTSLMKDPLGTRTELKGSDRRRLRQIDQVLADARAPHWRVLGDRAFDAHTAWRLLLS